MSNGKTNWIWTSDWHAEDKDAPGLVLFRYVLNLENAPASAKVKISADTRYKLYINGEMAEMGPSRGDGQIWYYDEPEILSYLKKGTNVFAVQVLRYPTEHHKGNHGMYRTEFPGLYIAGTVTDICGISYSINAANCGSPAGNVNPTGSDSPANSNSHASRQSESAWKCMKDTGFHIISEAEGFAPLQIYEEYHSEPRFIGWMGADYDDGFWKPAAIYPFMNEAVSPGNLHPRTIPFLYRKKGEFKRVIIRKSAYDSDAWMKLAGIPATEDSDFGRQNSGKPIPETQTDRQTAGRQASGRQPIIIPPRTEEIVELDAGEEMTAYLDLSVCGGKGSVITLLQSESYVTDGPDGLPVKNNRADVEHGYLIGHTDTYYPSGCGETYEPFWFRTFRFIRMTIRTGDEPLKLNGISFTETGYPLAEFDRPEASDKRFEGIWEISERTLRRCMHETYEDCPFYEQLQYAMDSRSEILYTYAVTGDDRLARKCMDDFKRSQRYDGMINCSYPNFGPNIIPGFSIYYILMLYDHMQYFGDRELLTDHLPVIARALRFFHVRLDEKGYVTRVGGLNGKASKWSFIDWTPEWKETTGVPTAVLQGPVTMESLLYIMGLQHAALIADYLDRPEQASLWLEEAERVQEAVRTYCTGANGMLQDGPGIEEYSQHAQVFAILTDTLPMEQGRKNLEETLLYPDKYAQCSVAMTYYLFRALQKTDMYVWTQEYWNIWETMIRKGSTTCVEDPVSERSDCHAWGALILYELPSVILGVRPASSGYKTVKIAPEPGYLTHASGSVITPYGPVKVSWSVENEAELFYELPDGVHAVVDKSALERTAGRRTGIL